MTEENYNYRTSQTLLRNQFPGKGKLKIPIIPKFQESPGDFDDLLLIGFDKTHLEDQNHLDRMVHFFLYDYRFERVWKNPDNDIEKLSRYRAVLSPDFSMYLEMAPVMQLYNVFRNRWCGAYWASKGLRVIPTVNWGDESTFDFCFEGIEKGSVVAVSTYMASEHDNRCDQKEWFMAGYNEMLRRIDPEKIICYNTPFPEMQGNIIHVDYERSSWRYMNYERSFHREDLDAFKIGGTSSNNRDTIEPYLIGKGGGSAYGGEIKPSKPEDERFWGEPGETKYTYTAKGELIETMVSPSIMKFHTNIASYGISQAFTSAKNRLPRAFYTGGTRTWQHGSAQTALKIIGLKQSVISNSVCGAAAKSSSSGMACCTVALAVFLLRQMQRLKW